MNDNSVIIGIEMAFLSSVLIDENALSLVPIVRAEHFLQGAHQLIFSSITELEKKGEPHFEPLLISDLLANGDDLKKAGGLSYISLLLDYIPTSAHVEQYARRIVEHYSQREIKNIANGGGSLVDSIKKIEGIRDFIQETTGDVDNYTTTGIEGLQDFFSTLEGRMNCDGVKGAVSTGIEHLDEAFNGGNFGGELIVVAGRPGMGKTSVMYPHFLANIENEDSGTSFFFSLEMGASELWEDLACYDARKIPNAVLKTGNKHFFDANPHAFGLLTESAKKLMTDRLVIVDKTDQTVESIGVFLRAWVKKHEEKPKVVIIDYLQLLTSEGDSFSRENEVSKISRGLKKLAKELDTPIIILSQINRECLKRKSGFPELSDLRESGAIEQDANKVIFVHRPHAIGNSDDEKEAYVIVAKNRHGKGSIVIPCQFWGEYKRFHFYNKGGK